MKHKPNRSKHQKGKRDIQRLSRLCATSFWEWCDPSMSHQAITLLGKIDDALPFDWLCILQFVNSKTGDLFIRRGTINLVDGVVLPNRVDDGVDL